MGLGRLGKVRFNLDRDNLVTLDNENKWMQVNKQTKDNNKYVAMREYNTGLFNGARKGAELGLGAE